MILYHGSKEQTAILVPRKATGVGDEKDRREGVYASPNRTFALLFCIPLIPDVNGHIRWKTTVQDGCLRMLLITGTVDWEKKGYLYTVPAEDFVQLDSLQWITTRETIPAACEEIDPRDLRHVICREPHND